MKVVLVTGIMVFAVAVVIADMPGDCDMAGFYQELGCTALPRNKTDNSSTCPEVFKCPDLHPDPTKCYYRGVAYDDRTVVPQDQIRNPCSQGCSCKVEPDPVFECAAIDCVETFDTDAIEQCINTYELSSCCSTGNVCGTDALLSLKTCEVDGLIYKEGESFEPSNTRKTCICTAQFNGSFDNPAYCRDIDCGIEIHYQEKILRRCAPVFAGSSKKTCPISFECPTRRSRVIRGTNYRSIKEECQFGNLTLSVGDELIMTETCAFCKCEVPPFVSCTRKTSCDSASYGNYDDDDILDNYNYPVALIYY